MAPTTPRLVGDPMLFVSLQGGTELTGLTGSQALERASSALRLGATGVEVRCSSVNGTLLVELPKARPKLLRKTPEQAPLTLEDFLGSLGDAAHILVTPNDHELVPEVHTLAVASGLLPRVSIGIGELAAAAQLQAEIPGAHLVHFGGDKATRGAERLAAELRAANLGTIAAPHHVWTAGHVAMFHRFGRRCIALGASQPHEARQALQAGVDGVTGPFADRLYDASAEVG